MFRDFRLLIISATIGLALALICVTDVRAQQAEVKQIIINSRWGGLGTPAAAELRIVNEGPDFLLGRNHVDAELVRAFMSSLRGPAVPEPNLENLGLTREWLLKNHDGPFSRYQGGPDNRATNQQELYRKRFDDPSFVSQLLPGLFPPRAFHTDDYPGIHVQIDLADGSSATLSSHSQSPYMLPWSVTVAGTTHDTYDANISRALAAIMPKKTVNRERISGEGLTEAIKEVADRVVEPELNLLDAENRAGDALAEIRKQFTVVDAEINSFHHPEYGTEWSGNQPHETNLHATLTRQTLPTKVSDALVLESRENKADGVDGFLQSISKYESLALSVPWLSSYIQGNGKVPIRISYVHDASMGAKAMMVFAADMHAIHRDDLTQELRSQQSDTVLLIVGNTYAESYWLVLSDKRMVLWRFNGPSGLLKWNPSDFVTAECADYGEPFGGCVGATISPDGSLLR